MRSRNYGLRNEPNPVFAPRPGRLIAKQSQSAVGSPAWSRAMRSSRHKSRALFSGSHDSDDVLDHGDWILVNRQGEIKRNWLNNLAQ